MSHLALTSKSTYAHFIFVLLHKVPNAKGYSQFLHTITGASRDRASIKPNNEFKTTRSGKARELQAVAQPKVSKWSSFRAKLAGIFSVSRKRMITNEPESGAGYDRRSSHEGVATPTITPTPCPAVKDRPSYDRRAKIKSSPITVYMAKASSKINADA